MTDEDRLRLMAAHLARQEQLAEAEVTAFRRRTAGHHDEAEIAAAEARLRAGLQAIMDEQRRRVVRWLLAPHTPSTELQ